MSKIIGVTVGTPTSPSKMEQELKPVKTINGIAPDESGNANVNVEDKIFIATYEETSPRSIVSALESGYAVFCNKGNITLPLTYYYEYQNIIHFGGMYSDRLCSFTVQWTNASSTAIWTTDFYAIRTTLVDQFTGVSDTTIPTTKAVYEALQDTEQQLTAAFEVFYVTATSNDTNSGTHWYTADKTMAEIITAYKEGREVKLVVPYDERNFVLDLVRCTDREIDFSGVFGDDTWNNGEPVIFTAVIDDDVEFCITVNPVGGGAVKTVNGIEPDENGNVEVDRGSSIYVGSGDMPDGCNVQIDPDGEALTLPKLTFTGAVEAEYDGTSDVSVEIPTGGSVSDEQIAQIKANKDNIASLGETVATHTTQIEALQNASGGSSSGGGIDGYTLINEITLEADANAVEISKDSAGNALSLPGEIFLEVINPLASSQPDCYATVTGDAGTAGQFSTCRWASTSAITKGYLAVNRIGGKIHVSFSAAQAAHYNSQVTNWTQLFDVGNITKVAVRGGGGTPMMTGCVVRLYARG